MRNEYEKQLNTLKAEYEDEVSKIKEQVFSENQDLRFDGAISFQGQAKRSGLSIHPDWKTWLARWSRSPRRICSWKPSIWRWTPRIGFLRLPIGFSRRWRRICPTRFPLLRFLFENENFCSNKLNLTHPNLRLAKRIQKLLEARNASQQNRQSQERSEYIRD